MIAAGHVREPLTMEPMTAIFRRIHYLSVQDDSLRTQVELVHGGIRTKKDDTRWERHVRGSTCPLCSDSYEDGARRTMRIRRAAVCSGYDVEVVLGNGGGGYGNKNHPERRVCRVRGKQSTRQTPIRRYACWCGHWEWGRRGRDGQRGRTCSSRALVLVPSARPAPFLLLSLPLLLLLLLSSLPVLGVLRGLVTRRWTCTHNVRVPGRTAWLRVARAAGRQVEIARL